MKNKKDSLGDRMKGYEKSCRQTLTKRLPVIIRLDGKAFHTFTKRFDKPFDDRLIQLMNKTAKYLCESIQGCQLAYVQSDEISLLLHNYKKLNSQAWFDNQIQKIVSVSAGMASAKLSLEYSKIHDDLMESKSTPVYSDPEPILFDARVFLLPEKEVCNYFIWRQQDWTRNSIQMLARSIYSEKECFKKNQTKLKEMCLEKDLDWNKLQDSLKYGRCIVNKKCFISENNYISGWELQANIPIFTENRSFIEKHLQVDET